MAKKNDEETIRKIHRAAERQRLEDRKIIIGPDYEHWGRMDYWDKEEAVLLLHDIKPLKELEKYEDTDAFGVFDELMSTHMEVQFDKEHAYSEGIIFCYFREQTDSIESMFELIDRAIQAGTLESDIQPRKLVIWAKERRLPVPAALFEAVMKYHKETPGNSQKDWAEGEDEPLTGKERRELGTLRQEKKKWDRSIEAAVHASLFCKEKKDKGSKATRKELEDELSKQGLDIPQDTFNKIWNRLRHSELTHEGGRPPKTP